MFSIASLPTYYKSDNTKYEITPAVMQILQILLAMSPDEYFDAMIYLCPFEFYFSTVRRNDMTAEVFKYVAMKNYWFAHSQMAGNVISSSKDTPIPPSKAKH